MSQQPLPRIPRERGEDHVPAIVTRRRKLCEGLSDTPLPYIGGAPVPTTEAAGNIENMIGYAQVPIGIAGPLVVDTSAGRHETYVPMATTEGALVASYSRGMALLNSGGGARSRVVQDGLSQHPILVYESALDAMRAGELAERSLADYRAIVSGITRHGALETVSTRVLGRRLLLRLVFTTGDAVGINMASQAADLVSQSLAERTGALQRYVHGQDVEKRANARALVEGRGRSVVAEATVPRAALKERARVSPEDLVAVARTYAVGYAHLGTQNWTVQSANGLAAVMLACGQDVAYVTEAANGLLDFDVTAAGDLYLSVTLPSLIVGTVGGGSGKGTAAECLAILGCVGTGKAGRFAEILAAMVLAGDLSLMAAFCSHEFVAAHENLGRNRPAEA